MFVELLPLLKQQRLCLAISQLENGMLRVNVLPIAKHTEHPGDSPTEPPVLLTPLSVTDTTEQLDATFATQLREFTASVVETQSNLEQLKTAHKAALSTLDAQQKKEMTARRQRVPSKPSVTQPATPDTPAPEPPAAVTPTPEPPVPAPAPAAATAAAAEPLPLSANLSTSPTPVGPPPAAS